MHKDLVLETIEMSEIDKHSGPDLAQLRQWLKLGFDVGVMSEAGSPCIADPGSELVKVAHGMAATVVPLSGPSAVLLALMASGLNGQRFAFNGYLPVKEPMRSKAIKDLEERSVKEDQTQLFIETPYRNNALLADILKNCRPTTRLCVACNIGGPASWVKTKNVQQWKESVPVIEKEPTVFLILG